MALSDILKKYGDTSATEGIMAPSTKVQQVTTEQQVYDSATDGIMNIQGKQYTGPDATIAYGTREEGFPRMLRQIEQGTLPQFEQSQFPKVGEGKTELSIGATKPPVDTTPTPTESTTPTVCPPGFIYDPVKKVCVPIESKSEPTPIIEPRNLTDTAKSLKGNIDFTTGTTADDEKFRAGQYNYEPSRKKVEGFNLFSIGGSILHNLDQFLNEKDAIKKGILVDTTGDGKPDKIDMTQVTRNYQEEELGLPPGARAQGATESLKAETQYDIAKKLYEEGQIKGTPKVEEKTVTQPKEEPKEETVTTKLTEKVTPRFEGTSFVRTDFGLLTTEDFGNLSAAGIQTTNTINDLQKALDNLLKRPKQVQNRSMVNKYKNDIDRAKKKQQQINKALEAQKIVDDYNKQKQETIQASTEKQEYDKPRTQEQRQRETGQTAAQRASKTATTGKFERAKAGASVKGERLRGGI